MRIWRSIDRGGPESLVLESVEQPMPGPGEISIRVAACALNYPDALLLRGLYQIEPPRPFTPGSEVAGVVEQIGSGVVAFRPGDRVAAVMIWGGLAEVVVVPERDCFPVLPTTPFDEAAAVPVTYGTSYYALEQAVLQPGETVVVLGGAGGVGSAAIQLAKAKGAHVIAATSSVAKSEAAVSMGADDAVFYPLAMEEHGAARAFAAAIKAHCPNGSADVIVDPVGGRYSEAAFPALGWGGRHLVIGFTAGIPNIALNLPLLKGARIVGVNYGGFVEREPDQRKRQMADIAALHHAGTIRPFITRHYRFEQAASAIAAMEGRTSTGKLIVQIPAG